MYNYQKEKGSLYSDEGMDLYIKIRDNTIKLIKTSGCATLGNIIHGNTGDSFMMLVCVDRLVEKGILKEVGHIGKNGTSGKIYIQA